MKSFYSTDANGSVYKVYSLDQKALVATKEALFELQDAVQQRYVFQDEYTGVIERLTPEQVSLLRTTADRRCY